MSNKTFEQWRDEIERKISYLKTQNIHTYYGMGLVMSGEVANRLYDHFSNQGIYSVEVKICPRKLIDLMIQWA